MGLMSMMFGPTQKVSSDGGWISALSMGRTHAGPTVNEHVALTLTAVYAAVGVIADAVAQLPIDVIRKDGDRRIQEPGHPVARVLAEPNPVVDSFVLRNTLQAHSLLWGNGHLEIERTDVGGEPRALWPMLPDRTELVKKDDPAPGRAAYEYRTNIEGKSVPVQVEDVIHIPALGFDGLRGYSPIWLARNAVGLGLALEQFGSKLFANDAKSGGFLEHPGKLSPEAKKNISESMQDQGGLDNAHRMKVLEEGMKFHAVTIPPEDAQFLLTRTFQVEEIARLYRVPLHMLQSQAKSTSWGSGIAQMSLGFLTYTLAPWLTKWEQALTRRMFTELERRQGYCVKHNVTALLRGDPESRSTYYERALKPDTGWMTRNEVRALEDLSPEEREEVGLVEAAA